MPKTMLADITEGMNVRTLAYLKQKRLSPMRNKPGSFLTVTLVDRSGSINGKVWDDADAVAAELKEGTVVSVVARAQAYQGTLELQVERLVPWGGTVDGRDFMPAYQGDADELVSKLDALVASLQDEELSAIVHAILDDPDIRPRYLEAPAAMQVHGAYLHGLLEHVVRQAELAETACRCYPDARRDLVIAGVLLHDVGKIWEFSWGLSIEYSTLGRLVGHIVLGDRLICDRGRELGLSEDTALRLRHLILSHHGVPEYGAPVVPQTLEAVILHQVDNLEARATRCTAMLRATPPDSDWSDYDRTEERRWYRGSKQ
jgi:3'-5' exoribonuclease